MKKKTMGKRVRKSCCRKVRKAEKAPLVVNGSWPVDVTLGVGDWPDLPVETRAGICGIPDGPGGEGRPVNGGPRPNGTGPGEPVRL